MAGTAPSATQDVNSLISSQQGGFSAVGAGGAGANIAVNTFLSGTKAVPIVGTIVAVGTAIAGIFSAHHKAAMRKEAQTLNAAFPSWRQLIDATVNSYNSGEITATQAKGYVEQAKQIYYENVSTIIRNKSSIPAGGERSGKPGHDPCNAACYIAYHYIEAEAVDVEEAIDSTEQTGQAATVALKPLGANKNGLISGYQGEQLTLAKPSILSSNAISQEVSSLLPVGLKPYAGWLVAILAVLLIFAFVGRK